MTETLSSTLLAWLLTYIIHSTALLSLAWLLSRVRRWSPTALDLLWKTALVGGIVTATVQLRFDVQPAGSVSLLASAPAPVAATPRVVAPPAQEATASPEVVANAAAPDEAPVDAVPQAATAPAASTGLAAHTVAVAAWALIALVLGLSYAARRLILVGRIGDRRAVQDGRLLDELNLLAHDAGLRRSPRLTSTVRIASPIALGIREICVPETALTELDLEQQRSMLAHELAHLARRDPIWLACASLIERVFWFQPLNRIARRQIATSAEYLCDEWAVRRTGSGVALARCLAQVAEWIHASPLGVPVAGMAEERSLLVSRVEKLLEDGKPVVRSRRALALASGVVILATIAMAPSVTGKSVRASSLGEVEQSGEQLQVEAGSDSEREDSAIYAPHLEGLSGNYAKAPRDHSSAQSADSTVVIALIARLKDEDADVRVAAAQSLGKLEDSRAVPGLILALGDAEAKVRAAAAESLGQFKDTRAISGLSALLSDPSTEVKKHALDALSEFEEGVVPASSIVRLLEDRDADLRHSAAHALGHLKDRSAGAALAKAVRDPSSDVRQAAIEALGELHDMSRGADILPALADTDPAVRSKALEVLNDLRSPIPEPTLLTILRDSNADVRAKAAELAGERSVIGAIPSLRRMLEDPDGDVREQAVSALANIADAAASDALRAALTSKDSKVRRAAAEALGERRQ
jgi:beta-lactamase regulating signal transducer with metallopeptidase domain